MLKFLLWCILLVLCWPLAIAAIVLYPIVWLLLLPFRIVGIAVNGVLDLLKAIFYLPGRLLRGHLNKQAKLAPLTLTKLEVYRRSQSWGASLKPVENAVESKTVLLG